MRDEDANARVGIASATSARAKSLADNLELITRDLLGLYFPSGSRRAPAALPWRDCFPNHKRELLLPPPFARALVSAAHTPKPCPLAGTRRRFARRTHP